MASTRSNRSASCVRWLALAAAMLLAGCRETLYTGLSETEANQMRHVLLSAGIASDKARTDGGRWSLSIDDGDVGRALRVLDRAGLPQPRYGSTLESIRTDSLVPSASEDRVRVTHGLSQELAATIGAMEGVLSARVHLSIPDRPAFGQRASAPPSASVFVRHRSGYNLQSMSLAIRLLVARSVEGLDVERVSLVTAAVTSTEPVVPSQAAASAPVRGPSWVTAVTACLAAGALGFGTAMLMNAQRGGTLGRSIRQRGADDRRSGGAS